MVELGRRGANSYSELREEAVSAIREVVRQARVEDRSSVEVEEGDPDPDGAPTIINLQPSNPRAAKLGVQLDHDAQITFYVGRHGSVAEVYNTDRDHLLDNVRSFASLAISGNFREYVRQRKGPGHKAISRFIWPDTGKLGGLSYNVLLPRRWSILARKGWTEEAYEPY